MDRTAILDEIKAAEQNAADTVAKAESDKKAKRKQNESEDGGMRELRDI